MKILNSIGPRPGDECFHLGAVEDCRDFAHITCINHRKALQINYAYLPHQLDELYKSGDHRLHSFYNHILSIAPNYDVFLVDHENVYHPDFLLQLREKVYTVYYTGDDPDSSYKCSLPYCHAFDHIQTYTPLYNDNILMSDKFLQWGASRADYRPYGYMPHRLSLFPDVFQSLSNRPREIIYIGGPYTKVSDLITVKKFFGRRFQLYGSWGGFIPFLSRLRRYGFLSPVYPVSDSKLLNLYQTTKIGLNMHMSFGPSNLRLFELSANGVFQVTDNPIGTKYVPFIGHLLSTYENNDIQAAIAMIDYFLTHEKERISLSQEIYFATVNNLSFSNCFLRSLESIYQGILEKV